MADIEDFVQKLKDVLEQVATENLIPVELLAPVATKEIVHTLYPTARETRSVSYIDDDGVLHAMAWVRLDAPPTLINIEFTDG